MLGIKQGSAVSKANPVTPVLDLQPTGYIHLLPNFHRWGRPNSVLLSDEKFTTQLVICDSGTQTPNAMKVLTPYKMTQMIKVDETQQDISIFVYFSICSRSGWLVAEKTQYAGISCQGQGWSPAESPAPAYNGRTWVDVGFEEWGTGSFITIENVVFSCVPLRPQECFYKNQRGRLCMNAIMSTSSCLFLKMFQQRQEEEHEKIRCSDVYHIVKWASILCWFLLFSPPETAFLQVTPKVIFWKATCLFFL